MMCLAYEVFTVLAWRGEGVFRILKDLIKVQKHDQRELSMVCNFSLPKFTCL